MTAQSIAPNTHFAYRRAPDQDAAKPVRHRVVVIGAGPVGLSLAVDLAQRGVPVVVLDDSDRVGEGSRAICFAKRTLEIFDRLGVGDRALAKGVQWQVGKVFHKDRLLYQFDLLPEAGHKMPAFINLQQYYAEQYLIERAREMPWSQTRGIDLRWRNRLTGLVQHADHVALNIETPEGPYRLLADWVIACDGARSASRDLLGLDFIGEQFEDQFLIADVKMAAAFPTERWFWFEPPFHGGQSALLHKQPDGEWRIDLQLSPDADAEHERRPEIVRPRIARMLGHDDFTLEWVSVYRFQCRRLERLVHGRVLFAGDAAHQVSPFGARGANSGIQDSDNLGWKLAAVIGRDSPISLLESYDVERTAAAIENIGYSTRATDFIAPRSNGERTLRDAALSLATGNEFAKRMVNSGRLSSATNYVASPLSTADDSVWSGGPAPGVAIPDAPLSDGAGKTCYLTEILPVGFVLLIYGVIPLIAAPAGVAIVLIGDAAPWQDRDGLFARRFAATPGCAYLVRPDGHVAARFRHLNTPSAMARLTDALARAQGRS
jgi:3-(3-hydroxy-phenyl)propionate hydroxylase